MITNVRGYMYADDLALVTSGKDTERIRHLLQHDTNAVATWCENNELTVNTDKTKVLWVYPMNTALNPAHTNIQMNGRDLEVVSKFNYLGVLLDKNLTMGPHCTKVIGTTTTTTRRC